MDYAIYPPEEILQTTVSLPLSKSLSARLLVLNALTPGRPELPPLADCDDTRLLREALGKTSGEVNIGAAGTAMRFATAYFAATPGCDVVLDGNERMRQRPIAILVDALRQLGADISYAGEEGFAPLHIVGRKLSGGSIAVDASVSSQFLSGLALMAPSMEQDLTVTLLNPPASLPYLHMTVGLLREVGIEASLEGMTLSVSRGTPKPLPQNFVVEPDWSAASYWYSIAALTAGWVTLPGLRPNSLQGDARTRVLGERIGVITEFDTEDIEAAELSATPDLFSRLDDDMQATPDLVQTFAMAAAMIGMPFRFSGVHTLRDKETDRLAALVAEADKLGFVFEAEGDSISWEGRRHPILERPVIDTYGDHRMAMAFAPCSVFLPGIIIRDVEVVAKSYPTFWDDLRQAGFTLRDPSEPAPETDNEE